VAFLWYNLEVMNRVFFEKRDILLQVLIIAGRLLLGLGLGVVLSMVCLGIAWGLFIFSGASSRNTLLIMSMAGAGLGAGVGAYVAWIKLDRSSWAFFAIAVLMAVAGGVLGGLVGYQYGANREIECCAEPQTAPFTYTAFGATLLANAAMYMALAGSGVVRMLRIGSQRSMPP
jgi:hypothetical protein